MFERVLVTGADGFVASHLVVELERQWNCSIFGVGLKEKPMVKCDKLSYRVLDITDYEACKNFIGEVKPEAVFHLAAQPSVALSWKNPHATYEINLLGELNILEALRRANLDVSFHVACSSEEYGKSFNLPLIEDSPLRPCSHYAVSKVAQEMMALAYYEAFSWRVLVTRGFNQAGPGQSPEFVISSFAYQIARIEAGLCEPVIKVGNLEAKRDFTDVRDTVRALRMVLEKGKAGSIYNVCSGRAHRISDLLEMLIGMAKVAVRIEQDPERSRPSDIPVVVGDLKKIKEEVGWEPEIPIEKTLADTLDWWRVNLQQKTSSCE